MEWTTFIENLKNISGKNDKIAFVKGCKKEKIIKDLLSYTYDPSKVYGLTSDSVEYYVGDKKATNEDLANFFVILDRLHDRDITGNRARDLVSNYVSQFYSADLLMDILDRSIHIGMGESSINKAIPKLIGTFKVMLAKKYKWNGKVPFKQVAVSQKFDGVRCICIKKGSDVKFYSRTGKLFTTLDNLIPDIKKLEYDDIVLDGEIIRGDGTGKYFQKLMKVIRKKGHTMDDFTYQVFDSMSLDDFYGHTKTPFLERQFFYPLTKGKHLIEVDHLIIDSYERIEELWGDAMKYGWEGLMLRNAMSPYEAKRSGNLLKMKAMQDEEYQVCGFQEGTGRLKNSLGAMGVNVDGKVVWVGSGFSDEERDNIWRDKPMGLIVTVQYFEKTDDGSLRFPVFKAFRE